jgi:hypothetical protein
LHYRACSDIYGTLPCQQLQMVKSEKKFYDARVTIGWNDVTNQKPCTRFMFVLLMHILSRVLRLLKVFHTAEVDWKQLQPASEGLK